MDCVQKIVMITRMIAERTMMITDWFLEDLYGSSRGGQLREDVRREQKDKIAGFLKVFDTFSRSNLNWLEAKLLDAQGAREAWW